MSDLISKLSHSFSQVVVDACLKVMLGVVILELVDIKAMSSLQTSIWKLSIFSSPQFCSVSSLDFLLAFLSRYSLQEVSSNPNTC